MAAEVTRLATYEVRMVQHASVKDEAGKVKPMGNQLAFVGQFSECLAFVSALDEVKPGAGTLMTMERITSPYQLAIARSDGKGASFRVKSTGGHRTFEVEFAPWA